MIYNNQSPRGLMSPELELSSETTEVIRPLHSKKEKNKSICLGMQKKIYIYIYQPHESSKFLVQETRVYGEEGMPVQEILSFL